MIIVILAVTIALSAIGIALMTVADSKFITPLITGIGVICFIIAFIAMLCLWNSVTNLRVIDDKIAMYQEENAKIEAQIAETVTQYQQYETDIFKEVSPDSAITLVTLYPELKADTLVRKQIDVYVENNEKIKELKEEKISGSVTRWWLYFGK